MNYAKERIKAHNNWPEKRPFKAEQAFEDALKRFDGVPFKPVALADNENPEYQRCVGHLLDALEAMPRRPDIAFDACFRVIDHIGAPLFPKKGLTGVAQGLPSRLQAADTSNWQAIVDHLTQSMPLRTLEYLAKRLLHAPTNNEYLHKRAAHAFGASFYGEFLNKFAPAAPAGQPPMPIADETIKKASLLLKLYLSGKKGTGSNATFHSALDLTKQSNVPDLRRRTEVLLSLLLFMTRNERAHGNTISPFRTSKATISRYQSYYFIMIVGYVFSLSLLHLQFQVCDFEKILLGCIENTELQRRFFTA